MQTKCGDVLIIDDTDDEPDEQFSVRLTAVVPVGNFGVNETCITIIDDDREFVCQLCIQIQICSVSNISFLNCGFRICASLSRKRRP